MRIDKLKTFIRKHVFEYLRLNDCHFIGIKYQSDFDISLSKLIEDDFLICTGKSHIYGSDNYEIMIYTNKIRLCNNNQYVDFYNYVENIEIVRDMIHEDLKPINQIYNDNNKKYLGNGMVRYCIEDKISIEYLTRCKNHSYHKSRYSLPRCYQKVFYKADVVDISLVMINEHNKLCKEIFNNIYKYMLVDNWIYI